MNKEERELLYYQVGLNLREARKAANLSQEQIAEVLHLSRASVVNIEKGRQQPSLHIVYQVAKTTNTEIEKLLPDISSVQNQDLDRLKKKWHKKISKHSDENSETKVRLTEFITKVTSNKKLKK